tara:strand:+ start:1679 stop:1993 length:315 start_codon:yes stop_codon:yes gene_type:complete
MSEIQTVKLVNDHNGEANGYLVNGSMSVPMAEGNRHYAMVQEWIAEGNTPEAADVPSEPTYAELRAEAYPSIEDQLDMQYWDKVNGTNHWQQSITTVKATYPKE